MIQRLDEAFRFHQETLGLRAQRQQLLASNIANADTPGYKARDMDFSRALSSALNERGGAAAGTLTRSSPRHLAGSTGPAVTAALYRTPVAPSVDGNTVELDVERAQFADNAIRFEAQLAFVSGEIKTLLSAIQG